MKAEARPTTWAGLEVVTVGHSTRSLEELIRLLREAEVTTLADIRTIRRSRHNPQFEETSLASALRAAGIEYLPIEELGGLRHARKHSVNDAWRNANFRGFADHMQTATFERGLERLHSAAASGVVCLLCAEAVPWRCHRSLVADVLVARGGEVEHLLGPGRSMPHRLTRFAKVEAGRVTYPRD